MDIQNIATLISDQSGRFILDTDRRNRFSPDIRRRGYARQAATPQGVMRAKEIDA